MATKQQAVFAFLLAASASTVATAQAARDGIAGPYDVSIIPGGAELAKPLAIRLGSEWTMEFWVRPASRQDGLVRLAGIGQGTSGVFVGLRDGIPVIVGADGRITGARRATISNAWHRIALVRSASATMLYVDGLLAARASASASTPLCTACSIVFGSHDKALDGAAADIAGLTVLPQASSSNDIATSAGGRKPDAALMQFEPSSPHWPYNIASIQGQVTPQDAWTLPKSATPPDKPVAKPEQRLPALVASSPGNWTVSGWRMVAVRDIAADGPVVSSEAIDGMRWKSPGPKWLAATVPGTVLTTLVDRGVYPDPSHGLNNLAIPYDLAKQSFWYRTVFDLPEGVAGRHPELVFDGINYSAEVWVNGTRVGDVKGAFIRGQFDVGQHLKPGRNVVAVLISPPPHPGIAHEESLTAGVGENGGTTTMDGPTFGASEGWDWIPTVRDRNMGIWQPVHLRTSGDVRLGDPQIVSTLPKPDNSIAEIDISVPATNLSDHPVETRIDAGFDAVALTRTVKLAPHETQIVRFSPATDASLRVLNPVLWWPNGYGAPALHTLAVTAGAQGGVSDAVRSSFGIRQVTYEMSLVDGRGALERVAYDPTIVHRDGVPVIDVRQDAIRKVPDGWTFSFMPGTEKSPSVKPIIGDSGLSPNLVIRVNGVRIAARGGAFGMDDFMKRVDRARLEPYFRLHRDANVNVIRNWMGQSTEETFYQLADEYGLMVVNDFWNSTQDYNMEPIDPALFLANARDSVQRFRNHPSIVLWFGRNEGVPQPVLNEGLDRILRVDDGTRLYVSSSNRVTTHESGPWHWQPPEKYFTELSTGFAVEVGTLSFPTLESWKRTVPASDQWPISDTWAYHDWHQVGNGRVSTFMDAMATEFGVPRNLEDFERKAQMLNYESHRAIFEGMNAGLWTKNSGRLLWMTQPAWPSSNWQIFSSDYDTHGSFYGVKKAAEAVHVQMNLPDNKVVLLNNGREAMNGITVTARVQSLDGRDLAHKQVRLSVPAGTLSDAFPLDLSPFTATGPVLVRLEAIDSKGVQLTDNFYWRAAKDSDLKAMSAMSKVALTVQGRPGASDKGERTIVVSLRNDKPIAAIQSKLTLFSSDGTQILPAYFSDNYISLLPGERRDVHVSWRDTGGNLPVEVRLRGWNVADTRITVSN